MGISRIEVCGIKGQLGKRDLKIKEVAQLWSLYKYGDNDGMDEKTFRKYIGKICSHSKTLKKENFLKDGAYVLTPEIQKIFFCLLDSGWLSENHKNSSTYREELNRKFLESIDRWLEPEDIDVIRERDAYISAKMDDKLLKEYFQAWFALNKELFSLNLFQKYKYIESFTKAVNEMHNTLKKAQNEEKILREKWRIQLPTVENDSRIGSALEDVLIAIIADRVQEKELKKIAEKGDIDKMEQMIFNSVHWRKMNSDIESEKLDLGFQEYEERCEKIKEEVLQVFDNEKKWEKQISDILETVLDNLFTNPNTLDIAYDDIFDNKKAKNVGNTYINFFMNYKALSDSMKEVQSKDYQQYLQIKDTDWFKDALSKNNEV